MAGEEGAYRARGLKRDAREAGSGNWDDEGMLHAAGRGGGGEGNIALYTFLSYSASNSICASLRF